MKLACWNIRHGGGKRSPEIVGNLLSHSPDAIILTEFRLNPTGDQIRSLLADAGFGYQFDSAPPEKKNGVMIASRIPAKATSHPVRVPSEPHRWLPVLVEETLIIGTYFPGKEAKKPHWIYCIDVAKELMTKDVVIIGDVNTGKHFLDEAGATFIVSEYLDELEALDWLEAYRKLNPHGRDYTWYSWVGNGFRLDHAYLSPSLQLRLRSAKYSHSEREAGISDHSCYLIELD